MSQKVFQRLVEKLRELNLNGQKIPKKMLKKILFEVLEKEFKFYSNSTLQSYYSVLVLKGIITEDDEGFVTVNLDKT